MEEQNLKVRKILDRVGLYAFSAAAIAGYAVIWNVDWRLSVGVALVVVGNTITNAIRDGSFWK